MRHESGEHHFQATTNQRKLLEQKNSTPAIIVPTSERSLPTEDLRHVV